MRRSMILLSLFAVLISPLYSEVKISYLSGEVSVFHKGQWSEAKPQMVLSAKDKIRTASRGRASIIVNNTSRIWVSPQSEMEISSVGKKSYFGLLAGKLRAKVKLLSGNKFNVKTPTAVASIRGTEFVITSENQLFVLKGTVDFSDIKMIKVVSVTEGRMGSFEGEGKPAVPREILPLEFNEINEEWNEFKNIDNEIGEKNGEEQPPKKESRKENTRDQIVELRREIHDIAREIKTNLNVTRELTNEIKEADLSAGRTLRDVHGNLVRVEQHLLRPDNKTFQLLNLTKRSEYKYSDRQKWGFVVPSGSRLDVMDMKIKMNMALPEQITDWPSYISSKGDSMHPESIEVKMTNQKDEMVMKGEWQTRINDESGEVREDDGIVFDSYINGWLVAADYVAPDNGESSEMDDASDFSVWAISPEIKITKDGDHKLIRLYTEGYLIGNAGNILNMNSFTSSSENPFVMLKQIAGEQIVFARNHDGTSFFTRGNLDLVYTPDLIVAVAQKIAAQAGNLMNSNSIE